MGGGWLSSIFNQNEPSLRLIVGVNQIDKLVKDGWDERLNLPVEKLEKELQKRSKDVIQKLAKHSQISPENLEYYSALKRYRLLPLLTKIIKNAYAGFKLDNIKPADPFELADEEVREFVKDKRKEREKNENKKILAKESFFEEIKKILSEDDFNLVQQKLKQERAIPPKVAIFGKAGVGKTTTVNNLFNAKEKTSHTVVGTTKAYRKEYELSTGGKLEIIDLPGYGRSLSEDKEYEKIYQNVIPSCDLVFLIVQANTRDFSDDQEMVSKVSEWIKNSPKPER